MLKLANEQKSMYKRTMSVAQDPRWIAKTKAKEIHLEFIIEENRKRSHSEFVSSFPVIPLRVDHRILQ